MYGNYSCTLYIIECVWKYANFLGNDIDTISISGHKYKINLLILVGGMRFEVKYFSQKKVSKKLQDCHTFFPWVSWNCSLMRHFQKVDHSIVTATLDIITP